MSFALRHLLASCAVLWLTTAAYGQISINEILAENKDLLNADGSTSDWVELYNGGSQAVALANYSLTDTTASPRKWVFPANVNIPAGGYLIVLLDSSRLPSSNNAFPLNTGFSLKASGDRLELYSPSSVLVESVRFGPQAANYSIGKVVAGRGFVLCNPTPGSANAAQTLGPQTALRINEWMASPSSGKDWFELFNPGTSPVQLSGLYFTDSGGIPSPVAPLSYLGAGLDGYVRFYADNSTNDNEVDFKLGGSGDSISLFTGTGTLINSVTFGQQTADISEGRLPDGSESVKALNTPTPGESNLIRYQGLVVNEVLSHTDAPLEDAVEFYNQTAAPIDVSGWYLSNSRTDLKRYRVPSGTLVPAGGYLVLYEGAFKGPTAQVPFTFNSAHGDEVYLSQANANGELSGYAVFESFEASENAVSLGRYELKSVPGDYKFVAMEHRTFGSDNPSSVEDFRTGKGLANSAPKVGPVVINELMYEPPPNADASDNTVDEYIEIRNLTGQSVPLFDQIYTTNRWRLQKAVSFNFPTGASLGAFTHALIVSFDPAADPAQLAAFRLKYAIPAGVQIFGPYEGKLNNGGDAVELYKPDPPQLPPHPDAGYVPYIRVDKVNYQGAAPWPTGAGGTAKSLQRKNGSAFGNDPINWEAATPSAGKANAAELADSDGDGLPDTWETQYSLNKDDPSDASLDSDGDGYKNLEEYLAGTDPRNPASRLGISSITLAGGVPEIRFNAVPGKSYTVQVRNSLLPSFTWQKLASTVANSTEIAVQDSSATTKEQRYYRLATPATD